MVVAKEEEVQALWVAEPGQGKGKLSPWTRCSELSGAYESPFPTVSVSRIAE